MDRSWSPTRHQAAIVGHRRAGRGSTRRVTERSLARGTRPEAVSSGMGPLVRRRGPPGPQTCCTLRDVHLLRGAERENAVHALPGGVPIGPRHADHRGRLEAERVRPHRRLSLWVGFRLRKASAREQRQLFAGAAI